MKKYITFSILLIFLSSCFSGEMAPEYLEDWAQGGGLVERYVFSDEGYYALATLSQDTGRPFYQVNYTLYGSRESIPLCPKPNCSHDDLESCGACFPTGTLVKESEEGLYMLTKDSQTAALQLVLLQDSGRKVIWQQEPQKAGSSDEMYSLGSSQSDLVVGKDQIVIGIRHTHMWMNEARDGYEWENRYEVVMVSLSTGDSRSLWSFPYYEQNGYYDFIGMLGAREYKVYLYKTFHGEKIDTVIYAIDRQTGEVTEEVSLSQYCDYGFVARNPLRALNGIIYFEEKLGDTWYIGAYDTESAAATLLYPMEEREEFGAIYYAAGLAMMFIRDEDMNLVLTEPIDLQTGERVKNPDQKLLSAKLDHGKIYTLDSSRTTNAGLPVIEKMT